MKITCQSCQSKYTVSDEKVQGRTVKIKCRKCGATILVNSSGVTTNGGLTDPVSGTSAPSDGITYLLNVADGDQRSMTLPEIVASYQAGVINAETYVWADGMADWQPLGQVDPIVAALHAGSAPVSAVAAPAAAAPAPALAPEPAPVPSVAAAAGPAGQTSSGVESVAAAAAPRAAVRRDVARPTQDLFGGGAAPVEAHRPSSDDVATSAPLFRSGAAPGQRDENSMLFSLSALTAKAGPAAPARPTPSASEDSGLIDLKALAAGSGRSAPSPVASIVANDGGLFQLSAPIVSTARAPSVAPPSIEAPPKNRAPLFIGAGIAIAGLAIAGVFFVMKGSGETATTAPPVENTAPTAAAPATTTPPEPEPAPAAAAATATATPTAEASASAAPSAAPATAARPSTRPQRSTGGSAGKAPAAAAPAAAPAAPAAPKRGGCGCAPGDLMCAMQCSAKGK
ncbi:zinc-ribbon domain-containing protein [Sorangium sp. So ce131]|uniref:zinc-ribbon domain-containing protein n=1 Tax=Sorangium sp. So ce131 TaxID=3133282 RepID=UPI003F643488